MTNPRFSPAAVALTAVCGCTLLLSGCGQAPVGGRNKQWDDEPPSKVAAANAGLDDPGKQPATDPEPSKTAIPQPGGPAQDPGTANPSTADPSTAEPNTADPTTVKPPTAEPDTPSPSVVTPDPGTKQPPTEGGDEPPSTDPLDQFPENADPGPKASPPPPEAKGLRRLAKNMDIWIDPRNVTVVTSGQICRRDGQLEMFACLKGTKEHESIVAVNTKAFLVHAAFLAMGVNPGHPVQFRPEYVKATGPEVEVLVYWTDKDGKRQHARAQDWVRNVQTGKALKHPFVFGGSGFWESNDGSERYYLAEDGDFICVSNFGSALMDLPIQSSQATEGLLFEPFTDRIPPEKTPVTLVLRPEQPPVRAPSPGEAEGVEAGGP